MSEGVDELVLFADDADERGTFSKGFHGRDANRFNGVSGQHNTGSETVKGCWRSNTVFVRPARSVALEGEQQIKRLPAFKHPNRSPPRISCLRYLASGVC